jgi:hypothetical protein
MGKLRDYCLNLTQPRGRHKARVFESALGLTHGDATRLQAALLEAARTTEIEFGERDSYGQRYVLDFPMTGSLQTATIRSCWIILVGEDTPRLTSCWVL